jgi:hypothetical protein
MIYSRRFFFLIQLIHRIWSPIFIVRKDYQTGTIYEVHKSQVLNKNLVFEHISETRSPWRGIWRKSCFLLAFSFPLFWLQLNGGIIYPLFFFIREKRNIWPELIWIFLRQEIINWRFFSGNEKTHTWPIGTKMS